MSGSIQRKVDIRSPRLGLFYHVSTLAEKTSGQSTVARARSSSRRRRFARASEFAHRGGVVRPPASGARACLPPPPPVARRFGYQKRSTLSGRSRAFSRCGAAMVKYCIVVHLPCTAEEYMILKDDPEYVRYQLGEVGARELSRVSELGADGFVTQTIVNRPNIAVPRVLRPLLRGKEIEFRDVRRYRHGTHTAVPFETELAVFNSISDRVEQRARIRIANVRVDADGAVRRDDGDDATSGEKKEFVAGTYSEYSESSAYEDNPEDPFVSSPARVAERVALRAVGAKTCEIRCVGEVTIRFGPLSRRAEELTVANMRRAYGRFPAIMAEWRRRRAEETNDDRTRGFEARRKEKRPVVVDGIRRSVSRSRRQRGELGGLDARRKQRRRRRAKKKHAEKTRRVLRVAMAPRRAGKGGRRAVARQETTRDPRPGSAPIESRAGRDHRRP